MKQEAVRLHVQLRELERRRDLMIEEERVRGTPAQERERMLKTVKEDNSEIATMEKQFDNICKMIYFQKNTLFLKYNDLILYIDII